MRKWIKRALAVVLCLLASWLLIGWLDLLPRISDVQRAALERMRAPARDAAGERNAFELFWLLPYQVPASERADVLARDFALLDAMSSTESERPALVSAGYPRHIPANAKSLPCGRQPGCLASVRADPEAVRGRLIAAAPMLTALRELDEYDHLRLPFRPALASPLPEFQHTAPLQLSEVALAFVDGQPDAALGGLCRDIAAWRALKGRSDSMIFEMINLGWLQGGAQLYADLRAELPTDYPLPDSCDAAFGPPVMAQRQSCDVYRSEFVLGERVLRESTLFGQDEPSTLQRVGERLLLNREATSALSAHHFSTVCDALQRPASDWPTSAPEASAAYREGCGWTGLLFNPMGCMLRSIAMPTYSDYGLRDRDGEGMLRLLQLADWLARQPDRERAFDQRPEAHRQFEQPVSFENGELAIILLRPRGKETHWRIPLPASRLSAAD